MNRIAVSATLGTLLLAFTTTESNLLFAADNAEISIQDTDAVAAAKADKHMAVGRFYVGRGDYSGALYLFKLVLAQDRGQRHVEEVLARLTECFLALGVPSEAQAAADVLIHNFPNGHWSAVALDALKAAGLEPRANERFDSWISQKFKKINVRIDCFVFGSGLESSLRNWRLASL